MTERVKRRGRISRSLFQNIQEKRVKKGGKDRRGDGDSVSRGDGRSGGNSFSGH